ncbi:uncharacterized protein ColSpa_03097 [Colletotrichum spaethianum]|uniref:Uncharacterized protein n=1 Tax=Colletotrichum spaethianum TaxID=700344 RepID=A0AA37L6X6_9PEZI|nr:uncharacterized protein ColSpa_03097 [Colletotrichum spaethianum]GKT42916.1 hypothetical protein ColSpa_03097 [Colletotrichum spaethianum]
MVGIDTVEGPYCCFTNEAYLMDGPCGTVLNQHFIDTIIRRNLLVFVAFNHCTSPGLRVVLGGRIRVGRLGNQGLEDVRSLRGERSKRLHEGDGLMLIRLLVLEFGERFVEALHGVDGVIDLLLGEITVEHDGSLARLARLLGCRIRIAAN